jgi:hypothetical protein
MNEIAHFFLLLDEAECDDDEKKNEKQKRCAFL